MAERILNANDRCEARGCGAAAYFRAERLTGEVITDLCGHHADAYEEALLDYVWVDERRYINPVLDVSP